MTRANAGGYALRRCRLCVAIGCLAILIAGLLCIRDGAFALEAQGESLPVRCTYQALPSSLTCAGSTTVSVTLGNISESSLRDVSLIDDKGNTLLGPRELAAGEEVSWKGAVTVTEEQLNAGGLRFKAEYTVGDSRTSIPQKNGSTDIFIRLQRILPEPAIEFSRSQSMNYAQSGQSVTLTYTIKNIGNVKLTNLVVSDSLFGTVDTLNELDVDAKKTFTERVTVGRRVLVSQPQVSYMYDGCNMVFIRELKPSTINIASADLSLLLWTDASDIHSGDTIALNCTLVNSGNVGYRKLQLSDIVLGSIGSLDDLKPGKETTYSRQVIIKATTTFQFTLTATDTTGEDVRLLSNTLTVDVNAAASGISLGVQPGSATLPGPGDVAFNLIVANNSAADALNIEIYEETRGLIHTVDRLSAGESLAIPQSYTAAPGDSFAFDARTIDAFGRTVTVHASPARIEVTRPDAVSTDASDIPSPTPAVTVAPVQLDISTPLPVTSPAVPESRRRMVQLMLVVVSVLIAAIAVLIFATVFRHRGIRARRNKELESRRKLEAYRRLNSPEGLPAPTQATDYFDFDEDEYADLINSDEIWTDKASRKQASDDARSVKRKSRHEGAPSAKSGASDRAGKGGFKTNDTHVVASVQAPEDTRPVARVQVPEDTRPVARVQAPEDTRSISRVRTEQTVHAVHDTPEPDIEADTPFRHEEWHVSGDETEEYTERVKLHHSSYVSDGAHIADMPAPSTTESAPAYDSRLDIAPEDAAVIAASGFQSRRYRRKNSATAPTSDAPDSIVRKYGARSARMPEKPHNDEKR